MNKQPEVTEQTRKNLIAACFVLIKEQGKATVNEITKAAGYNRCTFYRYFTDTRQLLDSVEDEICENLGNAVRQATTDSAEGYPAFLNVPDEQIVILYLYLYILCSATIKIKKYAKST